MAGLKSKKGYALIMAIIFSIVILILSFGLYTAVSYILKEITIEERGRVKGYYTAVSGLRYAAMLLRNPDAYAYPYTVTGDELGGDFFADIGANPSNLAITIEQIIEGENPVQYGVTATYTY